MGIHASYKTLFLITYIHHEELQSSLQLAKSQPVSSESLSTQSLVASPRHVQSKCITRHRLSRVYIPSAIKPSEFNTNQVSEIIKFIKYCVSRFIIDPKPHVYFHLMIGLAYILPINSQLLRTSLNRDILLLQLTACHEQQSTTFKRHNEHDMSL